MAVPRLKQNDNNLYPGPEGAEREREFTNETNPKDIFTEYCIQLTDIDDAIGTLMDCTDPMGLLGLTAAGAPVPVVMMDNERWGDFSKTWQLQNQDRNISPPLIVVRRTDEQVGTISGRKFTIPNRKHFTTIKVPTFQDGIRGIRLFQMTQPTPVDATYEIRLIAQMKEDTTQMAENFLREYNGRQLYIKVKGKYFPTILEEMSQDNTMEEVDADRYYIRVFTVKALCQIQRIEDFQEIDLPNRIITLTEVEGLETTLSSQNIIASLPSSSVRLTGGKSANIKPFGDSNTVHQDNGGIVGVSFDHVTRFLKVTTINGDFSTDLSSLLDTTVVTGATFSVIDQILKIKSSNGDVVKVFIPAKPPVLVTGATWNTTGYTLSIGSSDGGAVKVSIPPVLLTGATWNASGQTLSIDSSDGGIVNVVIPATPPVLLTGATWNASGQTLSIDSSDGGIVNVVIPTVPAITIFYSDLLTLISANGLVVGQEYLIINRPASAYGTTGNILAYATSKSALGIDCTLISKIPDYANLPYWFKANSSAASNFISSVSDAVMISADNGSVILSNGPYGDDAVFSYPMPFVFNYGGINYNSVTVDTNGRVMMGNTNQTLYSPYSPNYIPAFVEPIIALFWNDLETTLPGVVHTFTNGTAPNRIFVVEYSNVNALGNRTNTFSGQVVFQETTNILSLTISGLSIPVGIQAVFYMSNNKVHSEYFNSTISPIANANKTLRLVPAATSTGIAYPNSEVIWNGSTYKLLKEGNTEPGTNNIDWAYDVKGDTDQFGNSIPVYDRILYDTKSDTIFERNDNKFNVIRGNAISKFPWGNEKWHGNTVNKFSNSHLNDQSGITNTFNFGPDVETLTNGTFNFGDNDLIAKNILNTNNFSVIDSTRGTLFNINSRGDIGIGTSFQTNKLTVNGSIGFAPNSDTAANLGAAAPCLLEWKMNEYFGGEQGLSLANNQGRIFFFNPTGNSFMMGGNVGIGTRTPSSLLEVNGVISSTSNGFKFPDSTTQVTAGHTGPIALTINPSTSVLSITPNNSTATSVDLSILNPYPSATTLNYFQGFTVSDVNNIIIDTNWNVSNNGEYTGPALTTNHRAIYEQYATSTTRGTLYSTDGTGKVNRYVSN